MAISNEKLLPEPGEQPLLQPPVEEELRAQVESLRREVEALRNQPGKQGDKEGGKKDKKSGESARPRSRTLWIYGIALLFLVILALVLGWLPRHRRGKQIATEAREEQQALPQVNVVRIQRSGPTNELMLPGTIEAMTDAPILARADGYILERIADIGDRVRKDQLLAVIAAPDLDQQVTQARAQLAQAESALRQAVSSKEQGVANERLAKVTADRYSFLVQRGAVARQDFDTQEFNYQSLAANVGALDEAVSAATQNVGSTRANLDRLIALQAFEQVRAPFDGIVTLRNIDTGALIANGMTLLFRVAQIDRLRTYISVPQPNSDGIVLGQPAQLFSSSFGRRTFSGVVAHTAGALDPTTRTLIAEVQLPNPGGILRPGMFVQVNISSNRSNPPILIPGDALIVRATGTQVAVLRDVQQQQEDQQQEDQKQNGRKGQKPGNNKNKLTGTIRLQPVTVGRDYGASTEVDAGLNPGDLVIENPNDDVREGAKVRATIVTANLDVQTGSPSGAQQNANDEVVTPEPGAEPQPTPAKGKQPSNMNKKRGPGY